MPLMDFLSMAGAAKGTDMPSWMPATLFGSKFSCSYGQTLSAFIGCGRQTHILGQELKMVTDPTSWLPLSPAWTAAWSLVNGAAGKTELYYGRNGGMTYVGPKFDINRTANWALAVLKGAVDRKTADNFGQEAIDKLALTAAIAMGLIVNGVSFGLDIAARVQYTAGTSNGKEAPTDLFYVLNTLSLSLTSRLVAVMEAIEVSAAWTNMGQGMLGIAKFFLKALLVIAVGACIITAVPAAIALTVGAVMEKDVTQGIEDAYDAISALGT